MYALYANHESLRPVDVAGPGGLIPLMDHARSILVNNPWVIRVGCSVVAKAPVAVHNGFDLLAPEGMPVDML